MAKWQRLTIATGLKKGGLTAPIPRGEVWWFNDLYSVRRRVGFAPEPFGRYYVLSVHRFDRGPVRDWRHMQRIKNETCGEDTEGVELYPAEMRCVDTSNEYWMNIFPDLAFPGHRFPFGFVAGLKLTPEQVAKEEPFAVQRGFDVEVDREVGGEDRGGAQREKLIELISWADRALGGSSNDAEHDALFSIREELARVAGYDKPAPEPG